MREPRRWQDEGAPDEARDLLATARKTRAMTPEERGRLRRRVARIATVPVAAAGMASLKGIAWAAGIGAGSALVLVGAVTLVEATVGNWASPTDPSRGPGARGTAQVAGSGATAGDAPGTAARGGGPVGPERGEPDRSSGGGAGRAAEMRAPNTNSVSSPPVASAAPSAPASPSGSAPDAGDPSPAAAGGIEPGAPPAEVDLLVREAQLLDEARALLAGNPGEALSRLERHAREMPRGKLGLEREFLAIDALRRLGRTAEARARGEALLSRSAGTSYEGRVRRTLDALP